MAREKLTDLKVKALNKPGRYGDGGGLWLQVREAAGEDEAPNKSWLLRYTRLGRPRQMGLGPYPVTSLKEARRLAIDAQRLIQSGADPIAERREAKAAAASAMTFKDVAELFLKAHETTWRNPQHRWQWRQTLEAHAYPAFGDWPVQNVNTGAVMKVLEPIWYKMPETASRVRGRIETVLDYAAARGWRAGDNPARWRGHVANLLPARAKVAKVEHHAALPWKQIGALFGELASERGTAATALRFTILTAARTSEALEARWREVDLEAAVWTVSADRMKAGREHRVPLPKPVVAMLLDITPDPADPEGFLFPGAKPKAPLSNTAMIMLLRRMGRGELTVHGFRSTFRDWAGEATNYASELAEAALAHTLKSKVEAAYSRGDALEKRRRLMEDWATFCGRPADMDADVVPIRQRG